MSTHAITDLANANAVCVDGDGRAETLSSVAPVGQSALTETDVQRIAEAVFEKLSTIRSATRYWSPERAAYECCVSERTFADWMAEGKVSFHKIKRRVIIDPKLLDQDLEKYLQRRTPKRRKRQKKTQTSALATDHDSGLLHEKAA